MAKRCEENTKDKLSDNIYIKLPKFPILLVPGGGVVTEYNDINTY